MNWSMLEGGASLVSGVAGLFGKKSKKSVDPLSNKGRKNQIRLMQAQAALQNESIAYQSKVQLAAQKELMDKSQAQAYQALADTPRIQRDAALAAGFNPLTVLGMQGASGGNIPGAPSFAIPVIDAQGGSTYVPPMTSAVLLQDIASSVSEFAASRLEAERYAAEERRLEREAAARDAARSTKALAQDRNADGRDDRSGIAVAAVAPLVAQDRYASRADYAPRPRARETAQMDQVYTSLGTPIEIDRGQRTRLQIPPYGRLMPGEETELFGELSGELAGVVASGSRSNYRPVRRYDVDRDQSRSVSESGRAVGPRSWSDGGSSYFGGY